MVRRIISEFFVFSSAVLPSPNSLKEVTSNVINGDKISNNGNSEKLVNCDAVVPVPPNLTTGLFVAHQFNNDSTKNSAWNVCCVDRVTQCPTQK